MSRPRRISGFVPTNTLSKTNADSNESIPTTTSKSSPLNKKTSENTSSTRYSESRYKRHKSSAAAGSLESLMAKKAAFTYVPSSISKTHEEDGEQSKAKERTAGIIGKNFFQAANATSLSYTSFGKVRVVDNGTEKPLMEWQIMMKITLIRGSDSMKPDLHFGFFKNGKEIEGLNFALSDGFLHLYYDPKGEGIGIVLSNQISFSLPQIQRKIRSNWICWICGTSSKEDHKLSDIIKTYKNEMTELHDANDISARIKSLNKLLISKTIEDHRIREQHSRFNKQSKAEKDLSVEDRIKKLKSKSMLSLSHPRTKRQPSASGKVISLPVSKVELADDENKDSISQTAFYGNDQTDQKTTLSTFTYESNLRRSTRSSATYNKSSNIFTLSDDVEETEIPEEFKPTLFYEFPDEFKISVTNQDFKCLYNHDWINDTILDFFMKYFIETSISRGIVERADVYLFSSFFYTKLISNKSSQYDNVKKWVTNSDLFSRRFVVLPVNINFHWFGCIILNMDKMKLALESASQLEKNTSAQTDEKESSFSAVDEKEQKLQDSHKLVSGKHLGKNGTIEVEEQKDLPTIIILVYDSLRQTHTRLMDAVKDFIIEYGKDLYNFDIPKEKIKIRTCLVPQQPNMSDCGVHVILNTKKFFEMPMETMEIWFTKSSHNHSRQVNLFFDKNERYKARVELRNVLWKLQAEQIANSGGKIEDSKEESLDDNHSDLEIIENFENNTTDTATVNCVVKENQKKSDNESENQLSNDLTSNYTSEKVGQGSEDIPDKLTSSSDKMKQPQTGAAEHCTEISELSSVYFQKKASNLKLGPDTSISSSSKSDGVESGSVSSSQPKIDTSLREFSRKRSEAEKVPSSIQGSYKKDLLEQKSEIINSQTPTKGSIVRLPTEDLEDIEHADQGISVNMTSYDSKELEIEERLSPLTHSALNERFKRLLTAESASRSPLQESAHHSSPSKSHVNSSSFRVLTDNNNNLDKLSYHSMEISDDDVRYIGQNSTDSIKKKVSQELESTNSSPILKPNKSNSIQLFFNSKNPKTIPSSPIVQSIQSDDDEAQLGSKYERSEFSTHQKDGRRSIRHLFKNHSKSAHNNTKLSSRGRIFDKFASKDK